MRAAHTDPPIRTAAEEKWIAEEQAAQQRTAEEKVEDGLYASRLSVFPAMLKRLAVEKATEKEAQNLRAAAANVLHCHTNPNC